MFTAALGDVAMGLRMKAFLPLWFCLAVGPIAPDRARCVDGPFA